MPDKQKPGLVKKTGQTGTNADHYLANEQLLNLIESTNTGLWERNIVTNVAWWSPKFCELLGYNYGEIELTYDFFIDHLVHPDDRETVYLAWQNHLKNNTLYNVEFRMLTKSQSYCWFESSGKAWPDDNGKLSKMIGAVIDIDRKKKYEIELRKSEFLLSETNKIANIGGWEFDVATKKLAWSRDISEISNMPSTNKLDAQTAIGLFEPEYRNIIVNTVRQAIVFCKPFDLEFKVRSAKDQVYWIRAKCVPIVGDHGKCVMLRGTFQNINDIKTKELNLQRSLDLLSDQNKRLQNFAHIVSHNLRSHSGNLQFMVNIFEEDISVDDRKEVFGNIRSISESLATTIEHLNEIVKIQTEISKELKPVDFATFFKNTQNALDTNVIETKAILCCDFSLCPGINYVPAYLESIFLNLLTNALKYRHPDRNPKIICETYIADGHPYLTFDWGSI
jgi:PAS domain S-box-containing protein